MNHLNPFAISGIITVALYLPLSIFVFVKGKTKIAKLYSTYIFSIATWGVGSFLIATTHDVHLVKIIWKISYSWVLFIPAFFYHTIHEMTERKTKWDIYFVYLQAVIFNIAIYLDKIMADFRFMFNSFYFHVATPIYTLSFIFWTLIVSIGHVLLFISYSKMFPQKRSELRNIMYLTLIGFCGGAANFIPPYGINLYPWGNFIIVAPCFAISHAILKHQFLDIKIVLKKSFTYSVLILLSALLYFGVVYISEKFIQGFWGYKSLTISIITAFAIGVLFFPLHSYIQQLVDKFIFKKTTEEISNENELLRAEVFKSEKLKSVAVLASGMAHEIKNPLTALKTFSEYLPNKLDDKEFLQKFSRIVGSEVNRIDELVNELLDFAKPAPIQLKETNLNKLITDTLDFLNSKFLHNKISIKTEHSPECDSTILLDPNKFRQALLNIFLNAIEAMKPGGTLTVSTNIHDSNVHICIKDTGCGIPQDKLVTIFDPFYSTKDSGTGLGLPITHGIIKDHGGEIKVASIVDEGTTFTLIIPKK